MWYNLNFIVDNLFSLIIKNYVKVISITLFLQIYILLTIVIMHYIFLISFGTNKNFKLHIYYLNSY